MSVVAKFQCTELKEYLWGGDVKSQKSVVLTAVNGEENKSWSKWTPSGKIEMQITNEPALAQFHIGSFYLVTFEEQQPEQK